MPASTVLSCPQELPGASLPPALPQKIEVSSFRSKFVRLHRLFKSTSSLKKSFDTLDEECLTGASAEGVVTTELELTEGSPTSGSGSLSSVSPTTSLQHTAASKLAGCNSGKTLGFELKSSLNPKTLGGAIVSVMENEGRDSQHAQAQRSRSQSRSRLHDLIHHPLKSIIHHGHVERDIDAITTESDPLEPSSKRQSLNGHNDTSKRSNSNDPVTTPVMSSSDSFNGAVGKVNSVGKAQARRSNTMDANYFSKSSPSSSPMEPFPRPHSTARLANMFKSAVGVHPGNQIGSSERILPLTSNSNFDLSAAPTSVFAGQQLESSLFDISDGTRNVVASAPSSRTVSRHENARAPPAASATPTINEGKSFLKIRRSFRSGSQVEEGELKGGSLSPARFLDKSLQKSDWSLSCKYKASHRLLKTNLLGHGATAVVKTVYGLKDREVYACKVYHRKSPTPDQTKVEYFQQLSEEYKIARTLESHRNVVRTLDLCLNQDDAWCTIMEFCDMGDLFGLLESYKLENKKMSKPERNCLFKQLLMGLSFIHRHDIAHRDIKPENLLINSKGELKISDFGVSTWTKDANGDFLLSRGLCGSEPYIAPEVFEAKKKDIGYDARKVDVWSAAIVYANLAFNGGLFAKADPENAAYVRFAIELKKYWDMEEGLQNYLNDSSKDTQTNANSMLTPGARTPAISATPSVTSPTSNRSSRSVSGTVTPLALSSSPAATVPDEIQVTSGAEHHGHHHVLSRDAYIFMNSEGSLDQPLFFFNDFGESAKRGIAQMLSPEPQKRPLIQDILSAGWIKKIGMCIGPDPSEARSGTSTPIDVTNVSSIRKMHSSQVFKNHTHRPPAKAQKQIAMGHLKDPYK